MIDKNRQVMFVILYAGYLVIVYVRQSVSYAAPVIAESEKLADSDLGKISVLLKNSSVFMVLAVLQTNYHFQTPNKAPIQTESSPNHTPTKMVFRSQIKSCRPVLHMLESPDLALDKEYGWKTIGHT